jgi:hypothetical protein
MSESQKIADLRSLLTQLDQPKQVAEALPLLAPAAMAGARAAAPAIARGATALAGKAKNAFQNFRQGIAQPNAFRTAGGSSAIKAGTPGSGAFKAGQAVGRNPGTAASIAATAGAAGMTGSKPQVANKPAASAANKPAASAPAAAPASTLTPQEEGEMGVLAQEFDALMGQDTDLDKLILQYQKLRPGAADAAP